MSRPFQCGSGGDGPRGYELHNILTIDVEEYYHVGRPGEGPGPEETRFLPSRVAADVERVLDLLAARGVVATFFVLGEVARAHPRVVSRIAEAGHEIASHGFHHLPVEGMTVERFGSDLDRSIAVLSEAAGVRPRGYRSPLWSLARAPWSLDRGLSALAARGFVYDSSLVPVPIVGRTDLAPWARRIGVEPGGSLAELPPLTGRFGPWRFPLGFGLGLRFLPLRTLVRAIAAENRAGRPAVVAFHPWELDPDPPAMRLPTPLAVAHELGLEKLRPRLERLLGEVPFGAVGEDPLPGCRTMEAA